MDYSILIGIRESEIDTNLNRYEIYSSNKRLIYSIAIIDILQVYNFKKKVETFSKSFFNIKTPDSISAVNS